ncbi:MAG: hypothetical protein V1875_00880 [Candidatus Altiarchaeota archaeon]
MAEDCTIRSRLASAAYVVLILSLAWMLYPESFNVGGGGFWMCLDYIREGTLYGGQPYCAQGPVIYYLGYAVDSAFGPLSGAATLPVISLLAHIVIYTTLLQALRRHGLHYPLQYPLLYILLVFRYFGEVSSSLATAFFMVGFWLFYESDDKARNYASIIPFTLAVFTKYSVVLPIAIVMAYSLARHGLTFRAKDWRGSVVPAIHRILSVTLFALSVLGTFLALARIFPNIAAYTIYAHTNQVRGGLLSGFKVMAGERLLSSFGAAILLIVVGWSVIRGWFDRETSIFPLMQVTLLANGVLLLMASGNPKLGEYYILPAAPFLLATMLAVRKRSPALFALLVLGVLVHPSIFPTPLSGPARFWSHDGSEAARMEVGYGLRLIPPQSGYVLTEALPDRMGYVRGLLPQLEQSRIVMIPSGEKGYSLGEGPDWAKELRNLTVINPNESQTHLRLTPQEEAIRADLLAGKYSLVIAGPPSWFTLNEIFRSEEEYMKSYCRLLVPNFEYGGDGMPHTVVHFKDRSQCEDFRNSMIAHYLENFPAICELGQKAQTVVKNAISYDDAEIQTPCDAEYDYRYEAPANQARMEDLFLFLLLLPPGLRTFRIGGRIGRIIYLFVILSWRRIGPC